MNDRCLCEDLARQTVIHDNFVLNGFDSESFGIETVNVTSIVRRTHDLLNLHHSGHLVLVSHLVHRYCEFTRVVLQLRGQEALREEETAQPVSFRFSIVQPILEETGSFQEIVEPATKRFQTGISTRDPDLRHHIVQKALIHLVQFRCHKDHTFDGFFDFF